MNRDMNHYNDELADRNKLRNLYLFDEITPESTRAFTEEFHRLEMKSSSPIHVFICSPGGECGCGFALTDLVLTAKSKIITVSLGDICSMAPAIFLAGSVRYITEHSWVMFHPVTTYTSDYVSFAKSSLLNVEATQKTYDEYILSRCKVPLRLYKQAKMKEVWIAAKDAIKYEIANEYWKGRKK